MSAPIGSFRSESEGEAVQRIRAFYFYTLGTNIRELRTIMPPRKISDVFYTLSTAQGEMNALLNQNIMPLKTSYAYANTLQKTLTELLEKEKEYEIKWEDNFNLGSAISNFEIAFNAEVSVENTFVVTNKRGLDTWALIEAAEVIFPPDITSKAADAVPDLRAAGRCIAFELGTAAGFHLLRAFETVVLAYRKHVIPGHPEPNPNNRNLGQYIRDMEDAKVGNDKVIAVLRQIKDLHRNPLYHPEDALTTDAAIDLLGIVRSAMGAMLQELPSPEPISALDQLLTAPAPEKPALGP